MSFHLTEDTIIYAQYKPHSVTHRSVTSGRKIIVRFRPLQKLGGVTKSPLLLGLLLPSVLPSLRFPPTPRIFHNTNKPEQSEHSDFSELYTKF